MKVTYYVQSDILHIEFSDAPIGDSQNIGRWVNMTFTPDGTPHSLEILNAAARGIPVDTVLTKFVTDETANIQPPSPEEIAAGRKARAAALHQATQKQE